MQNPIKKILKHYMNICDIESFIDLSRETGICRQTLYDRINNPSSFRAYELKALDDVLHFSNEDLMKLIRGV